MWNRQMRKESKMGQNLLHLRRHPRNCCRFPFPCFVWLAPGQTPLAGNSCRYPHWSSTAACSSAVAGRPWNRPHAVISGTLRFAARKRHPLAPSFSVSSRHYPQSPWQKRRGRRRHQNVDDATAKQSCFINVPFQCKYIRECAVRKRTNSRPLPIHFFSS